MLLSVRFAGGVGRHCRGGTPRACPAGRNAGESVRTARAGGCQVVTTQRHPREGERVHCGCVAPMFGASARLDIKSHSFKACHHQGARAYHLGKRQPVVGIGTAGALNVLAQARGCGETQVPVPRADGQPQASLSKRRLDCQDSAWPLRRRRGGLFAPDARLRHGTAQAGKFFDTRRPCVERSSCMVGHMLHVLAWVCMHVAHVCLASI
jgi:hypothetical protein